MNTPVTVDDPPKARRREQRGWYWYDVANSGFQTTVITVFLGPYLTTLAERAADPGGRVPFLGLDLRAEAYFSAVVSISVVLQIIVMPITGALADHTGRKKELLGVAAYLGAAATLGFYLVDGAAYALGGALFIVANVAFGAAMVVYNSFLPQIATADERDRVSSRGWGFGYLGGFTLLAANLALYLGSGVESGLAVRISLASAGVWWAVFTVIPLLRLRNRPVHTDGETTAGQAVTGSFRQLGRTIAGLRRYPRSMMFLLAYLIYNDGVQTVISFSATYADKELGLSKQTQITAILLVQAVAFGGALLLGALAARFGTKRTVLVSLVAWTAVVAVAYFLERGAAAQFYAIAVVIAVVMGGTQALSRSLYSLVIPPGREAEYFSLFEVSDKGSALLGSFTLTLALQLTGSYRVAILSLVIFFVAGFALLAATNLPRAVREAGNQVPARI
ncbi:MFS transporter [Sphaerisporangium rufum]|uniref:MFS transporter n=1 Tax=Sphaerisporangium rufum TaxID=1381558 RepID=A0A919UYH4_9ACTN|nr:MFS transporter [Sphaerisporangium rufum]GII78056.1 MFS transporter [Sphaerisporangium rufum]